MSVEVLGIVLLAAGLHAGWNALIRASSRSIEDAWLLVVGAAIWMMFMLPFLPLPERACWPFLGVSATLHIGYFTLLGLSYRFGQLSFSYPLMRGTAPVITALIAVPLLSELPPVGGWLGIALICSGVLLLSGDALHNGSFPGKAAAAALANSVVIACYTLVDGQGVRLSGNALAYTGWLFLLTALALLAGSLLIGRRQAWRCPAARWLRGLFGGGCSLISYALVLWAMTKAPVALVAALRESSVVIAVLIAACFLKEPISPLRLLSIGAVTAGAVALKLG